jgi:hypothetical protein
MAAVFENPGVKMAVLVVVPQEADMFQNHPVCGGSECNFQEAIPVAAGKADDGMLTVVDAEALTELIIGHDASPTLAYDGRALGAGWLRGHMEKDLGEDVLAFIGFSCDNDGEEGWR